MSPDSFQTSADLALVFDIDGTLTAPRQPINQEMTETLMKLSVPFFVAAGSHYSLLSGQFFKPLYEFGFRGAFDAFVSNGAIRYRSDFAKTMSIELISEFNLREHLGETNYFFLLDTLEQTLEMKDFRLPSSLKVVGDQIVDRVSMINLCPIGRLDHEDSDAQLNRKHFVDFDLAHLYRKRVLEYLNEELSTLIAAKQLKLMYGGQTSFDIGIVGEDKTKPLRALLSDGYKKVIFVGDALFPGGNDSVVTEFIQEWPAGSECPVQAEQVSPERTTIDILKELGVLNRRI